MRIASGASNDQIQIRERWFGGQLWSKSPHRRELIPKTDELETLRKWHARELRLVNSSISRRKLDGAIANSTTL
jgi:hypothetical protein